MNYRHAFHAGNFADLLKHATLLWLLATAQARAGSLTVIDTHAGRGRYDLTEGGARSKEAEEGVARLHGDTPPALTRLAEAVRMLNPDGNVRHYPGSPWLTAERLRDTDRLVACELRPEEHDVLSRTLAPFAGVETVCADGYDVARARVGQGVSSLVLIDPPFERPDDYVRCADTLTVLRRADPAAIVAVWLPIKDMETFDGFLRRLPANDDIAVAEVRLRPLINPMKMNGCAMVLAGAPDGFAEAIGPVCDWLAGNLGEAGARGEVWRPGA